MQVQKALGEVIAKGISLKGLVGVVEHGADGVYLRFKRSEDVDPQIMQEMAKISETSDPHFPGSALFAVIVSHAHSIEHLFFRIPRT